MANPLDRPLEDVISHTIVADLMGDDTVIRDPVDFARRAPLDGFRQAVDLAGRTLDEVAADHEQAGEHENAAVLRSVADKRRCRGEWQWNLVLLLGFISIVCLAVGIVIAATLL